MWSRLLPVAVLSCVGFAFAFAADEPAKNLIVNGDLEATLPAGVPLPKDWTLHSKGADAYKATVVEGGHGGKKSLLLEGDGEYGVVSAGKVEWDGKQRFALRGFLKVEGDGAKATIKFDYFDSEWKWIGASSVGDVTAASKGWQGVSVTDRVAIDGPKAKYLSVGLSLTGKGKAWFDDLELNTFVAGAETNPVENGSFENFVGNKPALWWVGTSDGGKAQAVISKEEPKHGKFCLHFSGSGEWAVAASPKIRFDKAKTYTATGFIRTKAGAAQIKLDYYEGDQWLGSTFGEDVIDDQWTEKSVVSGSEYPGATHFAVICVGTGDFDAKFDQLSVSAK